MLIRAWTREKVSLRSEKCLYSTHRRRNRPRQRPPDDNDSRKRKDKRTGTAILFFKKKTRRRRYVKARIFIKISPRERHIKKSVPVPRRKYEKTSKKLKIFECQTRRRLDKTPICPTFFQFFWSLLTEGSSVRTRQGEPKKLTAFCGQFFYTADFNILQYELGFFDGF